MRTGRVFLTWGVRLSGLVVGFGLLPLTAHAQQQAAPRMQSAPPWVKALPGYWVSLVTENWRLRMVTPAKGDYIGIPLTAAAQKIADAWDPAKDEAAGLQCKSYGAAGIMARPERLHISWLDDADTTLQMQIDDGTQTRTFHFGAHEAPADFQSSWQGYSTARWVPRRDYGVITPDAKYLQVTTSHMLPGYLRQNGVPYSSDALLTESYDVISESDSEVYLVVTTTVKDPEYLDYPLILSAIFQKETDGSKWDPTPCSASW